MGILSVPQYDFASILQRDFAFILQRDFAFILQRNFAFILQRNFAYIPQHDFACIHQHDFTLFSPTSFCQINETFPNTILLLILQHDFAMIMFTIMILPMFPNTISPLFRNFPQHDYTFNTPTWFCQQNVHHRDFA